MRAVTFEQAGAGADGQPLFVHFVNTLHWDDGLPIELIGTDVDFTAWLLEHHLPAPLVDGDLPAVHRLREHARGVTVALATGATPGAADMNALQVALAAPIGHLVLVEPETARPQLGFGTDASESALLAFRVALSLATFLESGDRSRLKLCANPGCGFAFADTSINRTRRWCFMRYCGNRHKVRDFRNRSRQRGASGRISAVSRTSNPE